MEKFKKGDRVRRVDGSHHLVNEGDILTVKSCYGLNLRVEEVDGVYTASKFILEETAIIKSITIEPLLFN